MFNVIGEVQIVKAPFQSAIIKIIKDLGTATEVKWLYYPSLYAPIINAECTIFGLQIVRLYQHWESNFVTARDNTGNHYIVILGKCL